MRRILLIRNAERNTQSNLTKRSVAADVHYDESNLTKRSVAADVHYDENLIRLPF